MRSGTHQQRRGSVLQSRRSRTARRLNAIGGNGAALRLAGSTAEGMAMRLGRILAVAAVLLCGAADIPAKTVNVSVGGYTTSGGNYYGGSTESPVLMFNPA